MAYRTFADLRTQVERELDIEDEQFIQPEELTGYFNSAVTIVESEIIKLGLREKYLQTEAFVSVTAGVADYDLPTNIIDTKIRKIIYRNGSIIYEVEPLKNEEQYLLEDIYNQYSANEQYWYQIYKLTGNQWKLRLTPKASATVTNALRVIYYKDLNRLPVATDTTTECDVPWICYEFILSYVRRKVYKKETHVNTATEQAELDQMLQLMRETLQGQIADPNIDTIDLDTSIYEEMS